MWHVDHDMLLENFRQARFRKTPTLVFTHLEHDEYLGRIEYCLQVTGDEIEEEASVVNRSALNALFMRISTPKNNGPYDVGFLLESDFNDLFDVAAQEQDTDLTNPNLRVVKTAYAQLLKFKETIPNSLKAEERYHTQKVVSFTNGNIIRPV